MSGFLISLSSKGSFSLMTHVWRLSWLLNRSFPAITVIGFSHQPSKGVAEWSKAPIKRQKVLINSFVCYCPKMRLRSKCPFIPNRQGRVLWPIEASSAWRVVGTPSTVETSRRCREKSPESREFRNTGNGSKADLNYKTKTKAEAQYQKLS